MADNLLGPGSWLLLGLAFALFELTGAAPFVAVFFTGGALAAALGQSAGVLQAPWATAATFVVLSVVPLLALRSRLVARVERRAKGRPVDSLVGTSVTLAQELLPGGMGAGSLRGARWQVRNVGPKVLAQAARVRVIGLDGLALLVDGVDQKEN